MGASCGGEDELRWRDDEDLMGWRALADRPLASGYRSCGGDDEPRCRGAAQYRDSGSSGDSLREQWPSAWCLKRTTVCENLRSTAELSWS